MFCAIWLSIPKHGLLTYSVEYAKLEHRRNFSHVNPVARAAGIAAKQNLERRNSAMKIIRDKQLATLTLVPVEADEEQVIASIVAMLKPEDKLSYGGRGRDGDDDKFCTVNLHAGGREEERSETSGNVTVNRTVHVDSVELVLRGSPEEDKHEVGRIRD